MGTKLLINIIMYLIKHKHIAYDSFVCVIADNKRYEIEDYAIKNGQLILKTCCIENFYEE